MRRRETIKGMQVEIARTLHRFVSDETVSELVHLILERLRHIFKLLTSASPGSHSPSRVKTAKFPVLTVEDLQLAVSNTTESISDVLFSPARYLQVATANKHRRAKLPSGPRFLMLSMIPRESMIRFVLEAQRREGNSMVYPVNPALVCPRKAAPTESMGSARLLYTLLNRNVGCVHSSEEIMDMINKPLVVPI